MANRKELDTIIKELTDKIRKRDANLANGFYNNTSLMDLIITLRCEGIKIDVPKVYFEQPIYYELASEIVRQLQVYRHPVRHWLKSHIDTLIAASISIISLLISIHK